MKSAKPAETTHHEADLKETKRRPTDPIDYSDLPQPSGFSTGGGANAMPGFEDLYSQVQQATGCQVSFQLE